MLALVSGNIYLPHLQSAGICVKASFMLVFRPFVNLYSDRIWPFTSSCPCTPLEAQWVPVHRIPCHLVESTLGDSARSRQLWKTKWQSASVNQCVSVNWASVHSDQKGTHAVTGPLQVRPGRSSALWVRYTDETPMPDTKNAQEQLCTSRSWPSINKSQLEEIVNNSVSIRKGIPSFWGFSGDGGWCSGSP